MATKPLWSVPEDELQTEYVPLPTGHYGAVIASVGQQSNDNGWTALTIELADFTFNGANEVSAAFKGRDITLNLTARRKTARFTVQGNPQSVKISMQGLAKLAKSLGIGEAVDGSWAITQGDTVKDLVSAFDGAVGERVTVSIKQQPRTRNKVVQTNDKGEPIIDDEVKTIWVA